MLQRSLQWLRGLTGSDATVNALSRFCAQPQPGPTPELARAVLGLQAESPANSRYHPHRVWGSLAFCLFGCGAAISICPTAHIACPGIPPPRNAAIQLARADNSILDFAVKCSCTNGETGVEQKEEIQPTRSVALGDCNATTKKKYQHKQARKTPKHMRINPASRLDTHHSKIDTK